MKSKYVYISREYSKPFVSEAGELFIQWGKRSLKVVGITEEGHWVVLNYAL